MGRKRARTPPEEPIVPPRYRVAIRRVVDEDLDEIYTFIAARNPLNAARYVDKIIEAIGTLDRLPALHSFAPSLNARGVRQLLVGSHRVLFVIDEPALIVDVLGVIDQRRAVEALTSRMLERLED